ncbi:hypothetical protein GGX14DRAFT_403575 [Mycena pura]|uniref:Uncharacterized protein n=1 Tax=Mycena pura TaxID=153505 RepID=A0AAD6Y8D9_9AGAR|nr:hypothetical protein GGX14DRAFT_403575 [Mycena pura]
MQAKFTSLVIILSAVFFSELVAGAPEPQTKLKDCSTVRFPGIQSQLPRMEIAVQLAYLILYVLMQSVLSGQFRHIHIVYRSSLVGLVSERFFLATAARLAGFPQPQPPKH